MNVVTSQIPRNYDIISRIITNNSAEKFQYRSPKPPSVPLILRPIPIMRQNHRLLLYNATFKRLFCSSKIPWKQHTFLTASSHFALPTSLVRIFLPWHTPLQAHRSNLDSEAASHPPYPPSQPQRVKTSYKPPYIAYIYNIDY